MSALATSRLSAATPRTDAGNHPLGGAGIMIRFALRRERIRTPAWLVIIVGSTMMVAAAFTNLYGDAAERARTAASLGTPAGLAMTGPREYMKNYTLGAMMSQQMIGWVAVVVALLSILIVVRNTRTEEETGRAELVRSMPVGRHAQLFAAIVVAVLANVVLALALGFGLAALKIDSMDLAGSLLYGFAHAAVGIVFVGITAITVQITAHARGAIGMSLAIVGLAYVLRAAGDSGDHDVLSWLSPIGWAQRTYAYVDDRWWPLLLALGLAVITAAIGFWLSTRRDVGAGLRAARLGRGTASAFLQTPIGAAVRLHRGMIIGFAIGAFVLGAMYGSVLGSIKGMLSGVEPLDQALKETGGSLTDAFAAMILVVLAMIAAVFAVIAALRPRAEESGGRAEGLLATGLSRAGWLLSHVVVAMLGGAVVLAAAGFGFGVAGAGATGDQGLIGTLTLSALAYAPAVWVTAGVAVALYGWLPRLAPVAWALVVYSFFVGYLGQILQLPDWMNKLQPFGYVAKVPVHDVTWLPEIVLTAIAAALVIIGIAGLRRRDLDLK
ncbi:ABC transporter permease [Microlunatus elymi]|uniref:ABC transporter permease n=1 Tax=Microlunatus elymi TaxID=2596828 RepID=A0A516PUS9_9ACTN|nr:ABC transporter permease [Microlunatus elymi]QDP94912.1 ABC transporter permease [Microlunatus elymi]